LSGVTSHCYLPIGILILKVILMIDYRETLQKELKDPAFKQAWDSFELEYNLADLVIKIRSEAGLSQEELAKRIGPTPNPLVAGSSPVSPAKRNQVRQASQVSRMLAVLVIMPLKDASVGLTCSYHLG